MPADRPEEPPGVAPEETLVELFGRHPEAAAAFWARGMRCPGCPIAPFHTLADACAEYAVDAPALRAEIRAATEAGATRAGRKGAEATHERAKR